MKKHNYFTVVINSIWEETGGDKELRQPRTHAYRILCKPYIRKVRVKVKRLKEGKREEEEEEKEQQLTERFLLRSDNWRGIEKCMLFMKTSDLTLSSSYNNTDIYHNKAL